jgi:hypothetical protein
MLGPAIGGQRSAALAARGTELKRRRARSASQVILSAEGAEFETPDQSVICSPSLPLAEKYAVQNLVAIESSVLTPAVLRQPGPRQGSPVRSSGGAQAVRDTDRDHKEWITHGYFRTYEIAGRLAEVAEAPSGHELEPLTLDDGILDFLPSWQKDSVVHKFARFIADDMFVDDTSGPYVMVHVRDDEDRIQMERYLPVDIALRAYGISTDSFKVPPPDGVSVRVKPNLTVWRESNKVADACYDYFMEGLRLSQPYEDLLMQIADEVFHIVFLNRAAMAGLNGYLAMHVKDLYMDELVEEPELASLFAGDGRLKRKPIPRWARRAVFFRDHGRCSLCGTDLSGLIDALPQRQFDHMVPLAHGGLNDITNLQLLCQRCNARKSDSIIYPSSRYRRWYKSTTR